MLELARGPDGEARLGFGGDTLNTALYLSRLGVDVRYATALGTDPWSEELRQAWSEEGIGLDLVLCDPDRVAGLYAIRTDDQGERSFTYWRENSAARQFFKLADSERACTEMATADVVYLSGISLSLFDAPDQERLATILASVRSRGGQVVFDPNYRPRNWSSPDEAKAAIAAIAPWITMVLPTFEDETLLHGDTHPDQTRQRWRNWGAEEIVVKLGPDGAVLDHNGTGVIVLTQKIRPLDTTGAGDSFNAGYLHARLTGEDPVTSTKAGHALARKVICYPGAIIPTIDWNHESLLSA